MAIIEQITTHLTPADLTKSPATIPDPATTPVPDHLREEIEGYLTRYPDPRSATALRQADPDWARLLPGPPPRDAVTHSLISDPAGDDAG